MQKILIAFLFILLLSACHHRPAAKVAYPDRTYQSTEWTAPEKQKSIAIRHLYRSDTSSSHLIRLQGNETPHYHERHDLTVTLLSGQSNMHFQDRVVPLQQGDVVFIPKGHYHWAENIGNSASIVFAVFSPGFDGKDRRPAAHDGSSK